MLSPGMNRPCSCSRRTVEASVRSPMVRGFWCLPHPRTRTPSIWRSCTTGSRSYGSGRDSTRPGPRGAIFTRRPSASPGRQLLVTRGLGAGKAALQELDLAVVVRFVLGDMEPFRIVVGALRVHQGQPLVVTLPELGKVLLA